MAETRAFGKLILFGEHLVVYKAPAIVGAVSAYTDCKLEYLSNSPGLLDVIDNRPAVPNYKIEKKEEGDEAIKLTLAHLGVDPNVRGVRLTFGGDLCCASGIGASAAQVVSLARAISIADNRCLSDDEINAAGYEGEKGYHGTPSVDYYAFVVPMMHQYLRRLLSQHPCVSYMLPRGLQLVRPR